MRFDITKILFLLLIIAFQTPASAQETERDVCKQKTGGGPSSDEELLLEEGDESEKKEKKNEKKT